MQTQAICGSELMFNNQMQVMRTQQKKKVMPHNSKRLTLKIGKCQKKSTVI